MQPKRILQVFSRMDRGGSETAIMNYYRAINRSKIQFDFMVHTNEKCDYDDEIEELGGNIYRIPRYTFSNHFHYLKLWKHFLTKHKEFKIIHGHYFTISAVYFWVARKFKLTCIAHIHSAYAGKGLEAIKMNLLTFPIRYLADYYFCCSKAAGEWLFGKNIWNNNRCNVIKNSIDSSNYVFNESIRNQRRKELNLEGKFVIGHVGRFHPVKNHFFLIDLFKEISEKNPNTSLLLVGDGNLRNVIEEKVFNLGLQAKVIFTGVRSDIPELLNSMDVFILPSLYEGFPVTAIEAQANGLKCFISDSISNEIKITDLIEFISLKQSPKQWAEHIMKYAKGYERKNASSEIIKAGYDVNTSAKWLENYYFKAINGNSNI